MLLKFMLIGISISLGYGNSIYNNSTENLEFCLYTKNSVIKTINPFYVDLDSDKTIYFNNIEEYTKYLGPNWAGVSYCGNNTLVNYVGEYYKIVENKNFNKRKIKNMNRLLIIVFLKLMMKIYTRVVHWMTIEKCIKNYMMI